MAYGPQEFFQHLMSKYHIDRYVDVIAMHAYPESWMNERAETVFQQWVPAMHQLIEADRSGDALWVNEMGYPDYRLSANRASIYGVPVFYKYEHTRLYEAAMLFKFEVMAFASGQVTLTGWYRIDDFAPGHEKLGSDFVNYHLGLVDASGKPKPTLFALHFFNQLFGHGAILIHPREKLPVRSRSVVYAFLTRQNRLLLIGWLRSSKMLKSLTRPGSYKTAALSMSPSICPVLVSRQSAISILKVIIRRLKLSCSRIHPPRSTTFAEIASTSPRFRALSVQNN